MDQGDYVYEDDAWESLASHCVYLQQCLTSFSINPDPFHNPMTHLYKIFTRIIFGMDSLDLMSHCIYSLQIENTVSFWNLACDSAALLLSHSSQISKWHPLNFKMIFKKHNPRCHNIDIVIQMHWDCPVATDPTHLIYLYLEWLGNVDCNHPIDPVGITSGVWCKLGLYLGPWFHFTDCSMGVQMNYVRLYLVHIYWLIP